MLTINKKFLCAASFYNNLLFCFLVLALFYLRFKRLDFFLGFLYCFLLLPDLQHAIKASKTQFLQYNEYFL